MNKNLDLSIRSVRETDLKDLHAMVSALAQHHGDTPTTTIESLRRDLLVEPPWILGFIAEVNTQIVGYTLLCPMVQAHFGRRGMNIHHLFIKHEMRGRGIGTVLINNSIDKASALGCSFITVGTQLENITAQEVYLAAGFKRRHPSSAPQFIKLIAE